MFIWSTCWSIVAAVEWWKKLSIMVLFDVVVVADEDENTTENVDEAEEDERQRIRGNHFVGFKIFVALSDVDMNEIRFPLWLLLWFNENNRADADLILFGKLSVEDEVNVSVSISMFLWLYVNIYVYVKW